jgi:hypothetical protein
MVFRCLHVQAYCNSAYYWHFHTRQSALFHPGVGWISFRCSADQSLQRLCRRNCRSTSLGTAERQRSTKTKFTAERRDSQHMPRALICFVSATSVTLIAVLQCSSSRYILHSVSHWLVLDRYFSSSRCSAETVPAEL